MAKQDDPEEQARMYFYNRHWLLVQEVIYNQESEYVIVVQPHTPSRGWKIAGEESAERKRGDTHSHQQQRCIRRTTT